MINQQHPIIPSSELLDEWCKDLTLLNLRDIATQAAQWGADQELEACCEWLDTEKILTKDGGYIRKLRAARRPKPPSLKEEARQIIDCLIEGDCLNDDDAVTLLRVLEAFND
jgi:hypothetical protein